MATRYRLLDAFGGGEIEGEPSPSQGWVRWVDEAVQTRLIPGWMLTEVKPPLPDEPPIGAVVIVDGDACQRFDEPYEDVKVWGSAGSTERWTWVQLCALALPGTPTRLVPDPFAEPVELPWRARVGQHTNVTISATGIDEVGLNVTSAGRSTLPDISANEARHIARALWAAADAAEKEQS